MGSLSNLKINCETCRISSSCLPNSLTSSQIKGFESIVENNHIYQKDDVIFSQGQKFKKLYIIRIGCVKTHMHTDRGAHNVSGFFLPGELIGINSIHSSIYIDNATALETTIICEIAFDKLLEFASEVTIMHKQLINIMSSEISKVNSRPNNNLTAEQRIALFILDFSTRMNSSGFSSTEFALPMLRQDLGSYLGLTPETISRELTKLQKENIVLITNKYIQINNFRQLQHLSCG